MSEKKTILIIDDDPIITMQIEQILEKNDLKTITAPNGVMGFAKAKTEQPSLILLDRRMPEMDGNETLIQLKNNDLTKNIPVIMITGDQRTTDISTSFELGAVDYIVKPFDEGLTVKRIRKVI